MACLTRAELGRLVPVLRSARSRRERVPSPPRGEPRWSLWDGGGKTTNGMASKHSEQSKCERVAMASAGAGMCGGLLSGRSPFLPARDQRSAYSRRKGRGWSPLHKGPRHPGARNGKRFVQGKAGPIVFRVGMFGYVRLPYVRYFCWSLARPQMLPDRGLPIFVGRLLSTPGPRFCVAKSGAGLRVGFPLYMTPRARSDTRFLRYALTD